MGEQILTERGVEIRLKKGKSKGIPDGEHESREVFDASINGALIYIKYWRENGRNVKVWVEEGEFVPILRGRAWPMHSDLRFSGTPKK